ncbi:hypothetical protein NKJ73_29775 [Mesorhizobium sp. M0074]|uniref:hypothetical protein n=1 Tax=unclassified Mesorhizobium TaxID=325217 RepID=UPI0033353712
MATGEAYTLEVVLPRAAYGTSRHASSKLNNLLGGDRTAAGGSGSAFGSPAQYRALISVIAQTTATFVQTDHLTFACVGT